MKMKQGQGEVQSASALNASRVAESRRQMYKMFSDTLRPPPSNVDQQSSWSITKRNFPKVNSARPGIGGSPSQSKPFYPAYRSVNNDSSSRYTIFKDSQKPKFTNNRPYNSKSKIGSSTERGPMESSFHSQSSPSIPSAKPNCHLSNVLGSTKRCLNELRQAKERLSRIVAEDEQLAKGIKKSNPTEGNLQLAKVALSITSLCREAFVPAHRLNQTAIALYSAEDFLRYPANSRAFDINSNSAGRIKLPDMSFNSATVMRLQQVVDLAAETYNKYLTKGQVSEELQEILFSILRGYQDFYAATLGCQEIFKVLLYTGSKEKGHLQQFLLTLSAMDRSDILVEIQDLRRILDEIVIFLEKMSWGCFLIYRLAGGETAGAVTSSVGDIAKSNGDMPTYPAYPLLTRSRGPRRKKKASAEDDIDQHSRANVNIKPFPVRTPFHSVSSFGSGEMEKNVMIGKRKSAYSRKSKADVSGRSSVIMEDKQVGDSSPHPNVFHRKKSDTSLNSSNK